MGNRGKPTKGKASIYHRNGGGGYSKAVSDFYNLNPSNVKTIVDAKGRGKIMTGKLPDGTTVTVRPFSSTKRGAKSTPTLEIRRANSNKVKEIRYSNPN